MRPKGSPEELFHHRQRAIALLEQGLDKGEVARRIGVGRRTVRRWHRAWRQGGEAALAPKPACGAPPRLSDQQKSALAQALLDGAKKAGYANELWTGRRVSELIRQRFGVRYNEHYVLEVLRSLNFTPQRPEPEAREKKSSLQGRLAALAVAGDQTKRPAARRVAGFPR
jgi:putative transposase